MRSLLLGLVLASAVGCGSWGGAARFWNDYRSDQIVAKFSDQGPWGGDRWIQWTSKTPDTFTEDDVKAFATKGGWSFCDRTEYDANVVATKWRSRAPGRKPVFPLLYPKPEETWAVTNERFPLHIEGDLIVLRFESGWTRGRPEDLKPAYGFAVLGERGTKIAVYHHWGDG